MIQILHLINGKRSFVKERGIHFERPAEIFIYLSLEVMSLKSNNADLTGVQNTTKWYIYVVKSVYCIISEVSSNY